MLERNGDREHREGKNVKTDEALDSVEEVEACSG